MQGVQLVFYGDSITKQWRVVEPLANGVPEVFTQYFGQYSAAILGVGGESLHSFRCKRMHLAVSPMPKIAFWQTLL